MKKLWNILFYKIDRFICKCIGINNQEITPTILKKVGNRLLVTNIESFRRHSYTQTWSEIGSNLKHISCDNKKKLGIAFGKLIAKNLTISFDNISIKKEEI